VIACVLIVSGIVLGFWPDLTLIKQGGSLWAMMILLFSNIPVAIAIILMEDSLKHKRVEMFWMWMWVSFFEMLASLPVIFLDLPIQKIAISKALENIVNGYECLFFGSNVTMEDSFELVGYWYLGYVILLVLAKINLSFIVKFSSSTLMWIAATCALPLANFAFSSEIIMGKSYTRELPYFLIGGLSVGIIGMIVYLSARETQRKRLKIIPSVVE